MVQWLRLYALNTGALGSIPSQGARAHVLQLTPGADKQINKFYFLNREINDLKESSEENVGYVGNNVKRGLGEQSVFAF